MRPIAKSLGTISLGLLLAWPASAALAQALSPDPATMTDDQLYEMAKKEGSLTLYVSAPIANVQRFDAEFTKKYPGIAVQELRFLGAEQYQKFVQETDAHQYVADVLQLANYPQTMDLIQNGYIAEWKVPTADRYPDIARINGDFAYAPYISVNNISYNTKKVTPEEVELLRKDWKNILDLRFKGRISVTDQSTDVNFAALAMFLDPKNKDKYGEQFLKDLAAMKPKIYTDITVTMDRLAAGESDIAFWGAPGTSYAPYMAGAPIGWVTPSPTPSYYPFLEMISKTAPHPYAARLFQNWQFSEEGAAAYQAQYGAKSAMEGVDDTRKVTKESWYQPPGELYPPDPQRMLTEYDKDIKAYHDALTSAK